MAIAAKKTGYVLTVVLTLCLGAGCKSSAEPQPLSFQDGLFSYNLDELIAGVFNSLSPTMTLNEWFNTITPWSYDRWSQKEGTCFYKDQTLETPFGGSDIVDENTIVHSNLSFNGGGKQLGIITGKITLTNIPDPAAKVYIQNSGKGWWFNGKVDMSKISGTSGTLDWSVPLYEKYSTLNSEAGFVLSVLPGGTRYAYEVAVPVRKIIRDANANLGTLGTVSIKGVTLSGTINVTYNGRPVPHVEISASYPAFGVVNIAYLSSPEQNAPWSMILGTSGTPREIVFRVLGCSKENWTARDRLFDTMAALDPLYVTNQNIEGIVLNLGNMTQKR